MNTYVTTSNTALATGMGFFAGVLATYAVVALIIGILLIIAMWKIFTKAGEKGWKSLIPIYNAYIMFKIIWNTKMFWITLGVAFGASLLQSILPEGILNGIIGLAYGIFIIVIDVKTCIRMSKSFGHAGGYAVGLFFLPNIFQLILGFGNSEYKKIEE